MAAADTEKPHAELDWLDGVVDGAGVGTGVGTRPGLTMFSAVAVAFTVTPVT